MVGQANCSEGFDRVHDPFGEGFVAFFSGIGFQLAGGENDGFAHGYGDAGKANFSGAAGKGFVRAGDADGLDGNPGFHGDETHSGCCLTDLTIQGACTFRENEDAPAFLELPDDGFHGGHVRLLLIDGDGVPLRVNPFRRPLKRLLRAKKTISSL